MRFQDIQQMTRYGSWECDFQFDEVVRFMERHQKEGLDLYPDFQRAHVWTKAQQVAWIEFFLRGGKSGRVIYLNKPSWQVRATTKYDEFVLVDGKQRVEAIRAFLNNEIKAYGAFYSEYTDGLRRTQTLKININDLQTKQEVLQWYVEMNAGGTPHTEQEIQKVRDLMRNT